MYVSLSRLRVPEHRAPEIIVAFRARAHLVDDADGFVDLQVWQSDREAGEIVWSAAGGTAPPSRRI